jgi:hypothetical protein
VLTNDAIVIPHQGGVLQYLRTDSMFNNLQKICNNKDSNIEDILYAMNGLNYEDDDLTITHDIKLEEAEIFHNGKYYVIDEKLVHEIKVLLMTDTKFKMSYFVKFIKKALNNPYHSFSQIMKKLLDVGFMFNSNGDVIIEKDNENEGYHYYDKRRGFASKDAAQKTLVVVNPETFESDWQFMGYVVIGTYIVSKDYKMLTNSWITNEKHYLITFDKTDDESFYDRVLGVLNIVRGTDFGELLDD